MSVKYMYRKSHKFPKLFHVRPEPYHKLFECLGPGQVELTMSVKYMYRKLLKAQRFTFAADHAQVKNAQLFTRQQFEKNAFADPQEISKLLKIADQAAIIIEKNIVQGVKKQDSIFSLQLNEKKEMNDNDSIKSCKKQPAQKI